MKSIPLGFVSIFFYCLFIFLRGRGGDHEPPGTAEGLTLLAEYLIKTTAVLSTCLLLLAATRRSPAAIRHSLLAFFLIGLLLLPAFSTLQFGWETELLPGKAPGTARREPGRPAVSGARLRAGARLLAAVAGRPQRAERAAPAPADGFPPADRPLPGFGRLLTLTWFAGLAFLVLRLGLGIAGAGRLTREGAEVTDPDWRGLFARLLAAVRIRKAVRLKSHEAIEIPLTWGWLKPVVLIPARYREWSEDQRSPALLHELCHIKRGDLFIMFLVRFSLAVYWFNPLCWVVFRRLQQEQERSGRSFTTITGSDGTDISILFHLDPGENSGALYERITARVKQALPENLNLEPKFDAKAGAVTLKLSGSGTKGATTEFIGKLIDAIKSELNAGK